MPTAGPRAPEMPATRHIGLLVPSSNTSTELDFAAGLPEGVGVHSARMWMVDASREAAEALVDHGAPDAARLIGTLDPDVLVFACTAAGAMLGVAAEDRLVERLSALAGGAPVVSTNAAVRAEIAHHGARQIAILTPYLPDITAGIATARQADGLEVVHAAGMGIAVNREIGRVDDERLLAFAEHELADRRFDLLFVSCTNLRTATATPRLERRFGVPVVTSNGASLAAALRTIGTNPAEEESEHG